MYLDNVMVLVMLNVVLLVAGTTIDTVSALVIFTPLFLPMVQSVGMSPYIPASSSR